VEVEVEAAGEDDDDVLEEVLADEELDELAGIIEVDVLLLDEEPPLDNTK